MATASLFPLLMDKLNERKNRLLLTAQVGLPEKQFEAYRKILLDELGRNGFEKDLEEAMQYMERRNGQEDTCRKGGAGMSEPIPICGGSVQARSGRNIPCRSRPA